MERIGVKSTSATGLFFRRQALKLARKVARTGGKAHQVLDLFLLRADGDSKRKTGRTAIVEVPPALLGGYGGQNGAGSSYVQAVTVTFGPVIDFLLRPTARLVDAALAPFKSDDAFVIGLPMGGGHLSLGDLPAWTTYRDALDDRTGVYTICPSALTIAVCQNLQESPPDHPHPRSLFVARTTGSMAPGLPMDTTGAPVSGAGVELPLDGHPSVAAGVPAGAPGTVAGLEIAADQFADALDELLTAGASVEWGLGSGLTTVHARRYAADLTTTLGDRLYFVRHTVSEGTGTPRYTPSLANVAVLDAATLPGGDQPDSLSAVSAVDLDGYTFPAWVGSYLLPDGRDFATGQMTLGRNVNQFLRLWSARVGDPAGAGDSTLALIEVQVSHDSPVTVDAQGYKIDGGAGYLYTTKTFRAAVGVRTLTYAATVSAGGVLGLRKLDEFVDDRYDTAGDLTRHQWQAFAGVTAADTTPYLVCTRRAVPYEVRAANADLPGPPVVQGEPARRVPTTNASFVKVSEVELRLVGAAADVTPDLSGYFPALGNHAVTAVTDSGRMYFGDEALHLTTPQVGNNFPVPFCQYAPGVLLVVAHPVAQYTAATWTLHFLLIDVATGARLATIPTFLQTVPSARLTVSCMEQATLDAEGAIATHGRLLLGFSALTAAADRTDGFYLIQRMETITWLAREPSNVAGVYGGNALAPASLGQSMNLLSAK